ncbi:UNVERIFIED_CONTAM: hypothetical protein HDU68_005175 [Siphonaria sp. JEL0065]|nr:hypothetical protein HDU68_005175 [Siphonaria sp. JEL0065]
MNAEMPPNPPPLNTTLSRINLQKDDEARRKLDELDGEDLLSEDEKELKRQEIIATSHNIKAIPANNAKNNVTAAQYESLRRHYARKRARPNTVQTLVEWLGVNRARLRSMFAEGLDILGAEDVIIWDTENS